MKSLAALLKRDRSNSLIQAPPSAISLSSSQEPEAPLLKDRRSSTPPTFLQPPPHHRLSSSVSSFHNSLFPEPPAHPLGHASSYSTSYYSESDDNVLADPFAAGPPPKGDSTSSVSSHLGCSGASPESTSTHSNSTHSLPPSAFRHRVVQEPSPAPYSVNEPPSRSGVTTPSEKKGSWLRERRSRTSLVRSKSNIFSDPASTAPSLPTRVLERKISFFARNRNGSESAVTQTIQPTHTPQQLLQTTTIVHQPRSTDNDLNNATLSRDPIPHTLEPLFVLSHPPDSWMHVGGVVREKALPSLPASPRPRALSAPTRPPRPDDPHPPLPNEQHPPTSSKFGPHLSAPEHQSPLPAYRPGTAPNYPDTPSPHLNEKRPSSRHLSSQSIEGPLLKSALKYRPIDRSTHAHQLSPVNPLKISKREGTASDPYQLPTPPPPGTLRDWRHASTDCSESSYPGSLDASSDASISTPESTCVTPERALSRASAHSGSITKGHGLATSDSRSLPVLDSIWGSFVSETSFPPTPRGSISIKHPSEVDAQIPLNFSLANSRGGSGTLRYGHKRRKSWSTPPSAPPPLIDLPPIPTGPPSSTVSIKSHGGSRRRNRSRSFVNPSVLLTPPISPSEAVGLRSLGLVVPTSVSDSSLLAVPSGRKDEEQAPNQQTGSKHSRSTSSPSIQPSQTPTASQIAVMTRGSRSQSVTQSSSYRGPVPGAPITSNAPTPLSYPRPSTGRLVPLRPGFSAPQYKVDSARPATAPGVRHHRGSSSLTSAASSMYDSDDILSEFPSVPSNGIQPQGQNEQGLYVDGNQGGWQKLSTPIITTSWVAHALDADLDGCEVLYGPNSNESLSRSGSTARTRRQKHRDMRPPSSRRSNESNSLLQVPQAEYLRDECVFRDSARLGKRS